MSGHLQGIIGRAIPRSNTVEYRKGRSQWFLYPSVVPNRFHVAGEGKVDSTHPTRKDAIERIEYLLTRG